MKSRGGGSLEKRDQPNDVQCFASRIEALSVLIFRKTGPEELK